MQDMMVEVLPALANKKKKKVFQLHWSLLDRFYLVVGDSLSAFIHRKAC